MEQVAFTNDTKKTIHIGPKSVRPGETREVDPSMIPAKLKSKAHGLVEKNDQASEPELNPVLLILDGTVADVLKAIAEKNNDGSYKYSTDDLSALEQAEQAGNTRKGVIEGLTEERLARANAVQEMETFVQELSEMSDPDLEAARDLHVDEPGMLALVQQEMDKRANAS